MLCLSLRGALLDCGSCTDEAGCLVRITGWDVPQEFSAVGSKVSAHCLCFTLLR